MMHDIQTILNAHFEWVVLQVNITNAFNTISYKVIFEKL
jgi:hypothetical protein